MFCPRPGQRHRSPLTHPRARRRPVGFYSRGESPSIDLVEGREGQLLGSPTLRQSVPISSSWTGNGHFRADSNQFHVGISELSCQADEGLVPNPGVEFVAVDCHLLVAHSIRMDQFGRICDEIFKPFL